MFRWILLLVPSGFVSSRTMPDFDPAWSVCFLAPRIFVAWAFLPAGRHQGFAGVLRKRFCRINPSPGEDSRATFS
jgi:hypothetical protein